MLRFLAEAVAKDLDGMLDAILRSFAAPPTRLVVTQCSHLSAGRAPGPTVAFDDGLLPIDRNWSYFEKLTLVPQTGPHLTDLTGPRLSLLRKLEEGTSANE